MMASTPEQVNTMWAAALRDPGRFEVIEVPRPTVDGLRDGEVLLRALAGGICGSDGPFLKGAPTRFDGVPVDGCWGAQGFPMHEIVGEVLASRHEEHRVGDRVVGWANRFDGLSEELVTDGESLAAYRPSLSATEAVLIQPLACVLHAADRLDDVSGMRCAVLGLGPIGALFAHVLSHRGAARVVGVDRMDRRAQAAAFGLDEVVVADSGRWAAGIDAADRPQILVEAVGHQMATLQHAVEAAAEEARIMYFGVPDSDVYPLDMERMVRKHLTLMAGGTLHRRRALTRADDYLAEHPGLLSSLVTHVYPRSDVQGAYDSAMRPARDQFKVVVDLTTASGALSG